MIIQKITCGQSEQLGTYTDGWHQYLWHLPV